MAISEEQDPEKKRSHREPNVAPPGLQTSRPGGESDREYRTEVGIKRRESHFR